MRDMDAKQVDVLIVGAGAAGLSAAGALKTQGIEALLLEQDSGIGGSWARRYDRLHLHTVRQHSGLAHWPIARGGGTYLSRDEYVTYLNDYAAHFQLRVMTDCAVEKMSRSGDARAGWQVRSSQGRWQAKVVIVAVGQYRVPILPAWPGRDEFGGVLLHSVDYRNAAPFAGKRVLVVGAGNSGAEIATDLIEHGAASVAISVRTAPPIVPRDPFGNPVQRTSMLLGRLPPRFADWLGRITTRLVLGDLTRFGFPAAGWRPYADQRVPVIDVGFVKVLKQQRVQVRAALARLTPSGAVFADGSAQDFDAIIAATGFATGLRSLIEPATALNAHDEPADHSGEPTASPGLYFIGYTHSLRGHLFEANLDSRRLAANVARYLETAAT
jgi:putative flavoprotein involved in K+ transport